MLVAGSLAALALSAPAAAAPRPDLVAERPSAAASAGAGDPLTVRVAIRNTRRASARPFKTAVLLSRDTRASGDDIRVGAVGSRRLKGRGEVTLRAGIRIPVATARGRWTLIACADSGKQVREAREGNNCAAGRRPLSVTAAREPSASAPSGAALPSPAGPVQTQPDQGSAGGGEPAQPPAPAGEAEPDPRTVEVAFDQSSGVERPVGEGGDTLTLDHAGRTFTLTIPEGALVAEETIAMRPVTGIGGYPFGGDGPAAVQLEPDGLRLLKPAVLSISPPPAAEPGARATTFAWHRTGEEFHLYPLVPDAGRFAMEISHFSGYGAGTATPAELEEQRTHTPSSADDAAKQELEDAVSRARACEQSGGDCTAESAALYEEMKATMLASYPRVIGAFAAAKTDEAGLAAIGEALSWMRMNELYSLGLAAETAALSNAIRAEYSAAYDRAWARCRSADTAVVALQRLISILRSAQLIAYEGLDDSRLHRCIQHRVSFESSITEDYTTAATSAPVWRTVTAGLHTTAVSDLVVGARMLAAATPKMTAHSTTKGYQGYGDMEWQSDESTIELQSVDAARVHASVSLHGATAVPDELVISLPVQGATLLQTQWSKATQTSEPVESSFTAPFVPWTLYFKELYEKEFAGPWSLDDERLLMFRLPLDDQGRWTAERQKDVTAYGGVTTGGRSGKSSATVTFAGGT